MSIPALSKPQALLFDHQVTFISSTVVLPFCVSALAVYGYHFLFNDFPAKKFGLTLLVTTCITVAQILFLRTPHPDNK